jgi:hypothetical protein
MFFEWLIERKNPGPVGHTNGEPYRPKWPRILTIILGLAALGLLSLFTWQVLIDPQDPWTFNLVRIAILVLYLCLSYAVYPQPRYDNMGWGGGLIGNPFRYTDDLNRHLLFLKIILLPGKLFTVPIVAMFGLWVARVRERKQVR